MNKSYSKYNIKPLIKALISKRKRLFIALAFLIFILLPAVYITLKFARPTVAAWWDETWAYRKAIAIPSHTTSENNVYVTVPTFDATDTTRFQSDCGDLRFTKTNGDPLPYYVVDCDSTATVHVLFDTLPAGASTYYMYYGNPSAPNGFSPSDFSTAATGLGVQTLASEEKSPAPVAYWKFDEGNGAIVNNSVWKKTGTTTNMTLNPSFEHATNWNGYGYWSPEGANIYDDITRSTATDQSVYGGKSGKVEISAVDGLSAQTYYIFYDSTSKPASEGQTWSLQATFKVAANAGTTGPSAYITCQNAGGSWLASNASSATTSTDWKRLTATVTCPAGTTQARGYIYVQQIDNGDSITFYVDGFQEEQSIANQYCDGSLTGNGSHVWNGTANASTSTCDTGTDGTITSATWQSEDQCINGKCLKLNGTSDYIRGTNTNTVAAGNGDTITISAWIKPNTISGNQTVFSKGESANCFNYGMTVNSGVLGARNSNNDWSLGSASVTANQWNFVTVVYTDSGATGYVNGKYVGSNGSATTTSCSNYNWVMGTRAYNSTSSEFFNGFIDDVKIYNYARSTAQIKADYTSRGSTKGASTQLSASNQNLDALSNGLVGYWKMDEATSPSLDYSGKGNNGTWAGNVASSSGKFSNATSFDGVSDSISVTNNGIINASEGTVAVWVKPNSGSAANYYIFAHPQTSTNSRIYLITNASGTALTGSLGNGTQIGSVSIIASTWHHVVITWKGTQAQFFVDGVNRTTASTFNGLTDTAATIYWGSYSDGAQSLNGSIDEARVYNRALSPGEVADLYNWAPGPLAYYNFEEGKGTTAYDSSGNNYNGTLNSGPTWTTGQYGKGLSFAASSGQDVTITGMSGLLGKTLTVEAWVDYSGINNDGFDRVVARGWVGDGWLLGVYDTAGSEKAMFGIAQGGIQYNAGGTLSTFGLSPGKLHLVGVYDGAATYLYINGRLVSTNTNAPDGAALDTTSNIIIADTLTNNIKIDEVRIYNYARSAKQVVEDMNAGHPAGGSPIGSAVGYWKFDEGYGDPKNSGSAQGINGTRYTAAWINSGKFGKALSFNGSSDYVTVPNDASLNPTTGLTISAWIKVSSLANSTNYNIVAKQDWTNKLGYRLALGGYGGCANLNCLFIGVGDGTNQTEAGSGINLTDLNTWHHVTGVFNSGNLYLYLDGVKKYSTTTAVTSISNTSSILAVGRHSTSGEFFPGVIDEVKIYNYALTDDEVKLDYNHGSSTVLGYASTASDSAAPDNSSARGYCVPGDTTTCSAPVGEWNLEEGTGSTARDTSGNGNDGSWAGSGNFYAMGKYGKGGVFNGSDRSIGLISPSTLNLTNQVTISAWIKAATDSPDYGGIIASRDSAGVVNGLSINDVSHLRFDYYGTTASTAIAGTTNIRDNLWHFVTGTYDGSVLKVYVDGKFENSTTITLGNINTTDIFKVGWDDVNGSRYFKGSIDQVHIYNYARTPAQIAWEYNRGAPLAWYKFDECQGNTAYDSTGNGNNGTLTVGGGGTNTAIGTCNGSAGEVWKDGASGKQNSSLEFDATDDLVTANVTGLSDKYVSVSLWIKPYSFFNYNNFLNHNWVGNGWIVFSTTDSKIYFGIAQGGSQYTTPTSVLATGNWYHIAGVYDGSNVNLYLNGKLVNQRAISNATLDNAASNVRIGQVSDSQIDDVRVYNYPLTATQVKEIYNNGAVNYAPATGSP